jgi:hypothetical protein
MRSVASQFLEACRYGQCRLYTRRSFQRREMVDRCVRVFDLRLHFANNEVIALERQVFADMWREKDKKKKKKKASKDRHYAFSVSNIFLFVFRKISHSLQISGAGPSRSKKYEKDPNKALQEFVRRQNDTTSDVSVCC